MRSQVVLTGQSVLTMRTAQLAPWATELGTEPSTRRAPVHALAPDHDQVGADRSGRSPDGVGGRAGDGVSLGR